MQNIHYVSAFDRRARFVSFFQCSDSLQYDPNRLLGQTMGEHLNDQDQARRIRAAFSECLFTGEPQYCTWRGEYGELLRARFETVEQHSDRHLHSDDEVVAIAITFRLPEPIDLSDRETEIVRMICRDMSSAEIAEELGVKSSTVETHRQNIRQKLGVKGTAGIVLFAVQHGLLE
ncbi:Oxygen regulatory protein NreC [Posidoniimonas corsicana]|uniref:Oxygen regulatory protein NreC n=1 Tax=Posidoniimonas corsicana TaxID=1938618 RepID=A0A5C5V1X4_9BACT|nr:helix-turn-helix transcriptional regulator [Posidoniimonas corsicana]TWT32478.1 Oxygen regulatory protein NreC [Posidoniimonas corsicana]